MIRGQLACSQRLSQQPTGHGCPPPIRSSRPRSFTTAATTVVEGESLPPAGVIPSSAACASWIATRTRPSPDSTPNAAAKPSPAIAPHAPPPPTKPVPIASNSTLRRTPPARSLRPHVAFRSGSSSWLIRLKPAVADAGEIRGQRNFDVIACRAPPQMSAAATVAVLRDLLSGRIAIRTARSRASSPPPARAAACRTLRKKCRHPAAWPCKRGIPLKSSSHLSDQRPPDEPRWRGPPVRCPFFAGHHLGHRPQRPLQFQTDLFLLQRQSQNLHRPVGGPLQFSRRHQLESRADKNLAVPRRKPIHTFQCQPPPLPADLADASSSSFPAADDHNGAASISALPRCATRR